MQPATVDDKRLDDDEKGVSQMYTPGGNQNMVVVNESGLYALLFAMQPTKARGASEDYIVEREFAALCREYGFDEARGGGFKTQDNERAS